MSFFLFSREKQPHWSIIHTNICPKKPARLSANSVQNACSCCLNCRSVATFSCARQNVQNNHKRCSSQSQSPLSTSMSTSSDWLWECVCVYVCGLARHGQSRDSGTDCQPGTGSPVSVRKGYCDRRRFSGHVNEALMKGP